MKREEKEKIIEALEERKFKVGMKVKIKKDAIKNGLLKEKCKRLMGKVGTIIHHKGITIGDDEVEVTWKGDGYNWYIPKDSLDIIK